MAFIFCVPCLACPGEHEGSVRAAAGFSRLRPPWAMSVAAAPSPPSKCLREAGTVGEGRVGNVGRPRPSQSSLFRLVSCLSLVVMCL